MFLKFASCTMIPLIKEGLLDSNDHHDFNFEKRDGMYYVLVRAVSADVPNGNGDLFSDAELKRSYRTFIGKGVFLNHDNQNIEKQRGKIVDAKHIEKPGDNHVLCVLEIDEIAYSDLVRGIKVGHITDVSMGCQCGYSLCSICGNKATTTLEYCDHIRFHKAGVFGTAQVYEDNRDVEFIELSFVTTGADSTAKVIEQLNLQIQDLQGKLNKIATIEIEKEETIYKESKYELSDPEGDYKVTYDNGNIIGYYQGKVVKNWPISSREMGTRDKRELTHRMSESVLGEYLNKLKRINKGEDEVGFKDAELKELKKAILREMIKKGIVSETLENLISDEIEAIKDYQRSIDQEDSNEIKSDLSEIENDEKDHLEELNKMHQDTEGYTPKLPERQSKIKKASDGFIENTGNKLEGNTEEVKNYLNSVSNDKMFYDIVDEVVTLFYILTEINPKDMGYYNNIFRDIIGGYELTDLGKETSSFPEGTLGVKYVFDAMDIKSVQEEVNLFIEDVLDINYSIQEEVDREKVLARKKNKFLKRKSESSFPGGMTDLNSPGNSPTIEQITQGRTDSSSYSVTNQEEFSNSGQEDRTNRMYKRKQRQRRCIEPKANLNKKASYITTHVFKKSELELPEPILSSYYEKGWYKDLLHRSILKKLRQEVYSNRVHLNDFTIYRVWESPKDVRVDVLEWGGRNEDDILFRQKDYGNLDKRANLKIKSYRNRYVNLEPKTGDTVLCPLENMMRTRLCSTCNYAGNPTTYSKQGFVECHFDEGDTWLYKIAKKKDKEPEENKPKMFLVSTLDNEEKMYLMGEFVDIKNIKYDDIEQEFDKFVDKELKNNRELVEIARLYGYSPMYG